MELVDENSVTVRQTLVPRMKLGASTLELSG